MNGRNYQRNRETNYQLSLKLSVEVEWPGLKYLLNWPNYLLNGNQVATCVTRKDSELL